MKNYKFVIQYVGEKFRGWQRQKSTDNTIQGKIEDVLTKMVGQEIVINGASRTDAGVHAYGQVATVKLPAYMKAKDIKKYCNEYLPQEIAIISVEEVDERFHARFSDSTKVYRYRINNSGVRNVFENRFQSNIDEKLNLKKMKEASLSFLGKHDFKSFTSNKNSKKSTERVIYSVDIEKVNGEINIIYKGNGFLYNMVRIMTGTLIEIGLEKRGVNDIKRLISEKKRSEAGFLAEAKGLSLIEIIYE